LRTTALRKQGCAGPVETEETAAVSADRKFDNDEPKRGNAGQASSRAIGHLMGMIDMRNPTTAAYTPGPLAGIFQVLAGKSIGIR